MVEIKYQTTIGLNSSQNGHRPLVISNHPESPKRIEKILERLKETKILDACQIVGDYPTISMDELANFHSTSYIEKIRGLPYLDQEEINKIAKNFDSVQLCPKSFQAAVDGISCCGYLAKSIQERKIPNGFAIIRPPGHHAQYNEANGFCIFNNVVYAARVALEHRAKKIIIIDFDVHHGQGTQRAFYNDPRVTYFSIHRYEHGRYWPHLEESNFNFIGEDEGKGHNINVPINEIHATDSDYNYVFWNVLYPIVEELSPDFVIFSAGFDSCMGDPLGQMDVSPLLYPHWIYHLAVICSGKILLVLEGGYHHEMLAIGVEKCLRVLLGELPEKIEFLVKPKERISGPSIWDLPFREGTRTCVVLQSDDPEMSDPEIAVPNTIFSCLNVISVLKSYWKNLDLVSEKWKTHRVEINYLTPNKEDQQETEEVDQESLMKIPEKFTQILPFVRNK